MYYEIIKKQFKRLNDSITQSIIQNYQSGFPDQVILGGFSTDRDIFHELCLLYDTINDINTTIIPNKNKLLLLVDPFFDNKESFELGVKFYLWEPDVETKSISYQLLPNEIIDNKIPSNIMHSHISSKEDLLLNLDDLDLSVIESEGDFNQLVQKLNANVIQKGNLGKTKNEEFNATNLNYFKIRLLSVQKFLLIIEKYLENKIENLDSAIIDKIDYLVNELINSFNQEEIFDAIVKEFKQNQIVQTLTNLLKLQVNITEKINEKNL